MPDTPTPFMPCLAFLTESTQVLAEFTDHTGTHKMKQYVLAHVPHTCALDSEHARNHQCRCGKEWNQ